MRGFLFLCILGTAVAKYLNYTWDGPGLENPEESTADEMCLMDRGSCGCCAMKRQMKLLEQYFNHTVIELSRRLEEAEETVSNILVSRSAFSVALTDSWWCFGPFQKEIVVKYQVIFINLSNDYNKSTGVFTVPRSGVYVFAVTVFSDSGSPSTPLAACISFRVNNQEVASLSEKNDQDQEDSSSLVLTFALKTGDHVTIYLPPGCFLCDNKNHYNTFTGFLLYSTD
ncbi:complement C1q-like protein 3 isoform X2 [Arapaima gigas]